MKKLIFLLGVVLYSCNTNDHFDNRNGVNITDIHWWSEKYCIYYFEKKDFNANPENWISGHFYDKPGKYNIGDTLVFKKK